MADVKGRVSYRQVQAQETRERIAAAARKLFTERGYASTSIEAIAAEVGVAVRTVYAAYGNKMAILGAICQAWLVEADVLTTIQRASLANEPREVCALLARASRNQWEIGGDILDMLQAAAAIDREIADLLRGWAANREDGMGAAIRGIAGGLRKGLEQRRANAIVRALTAPSVYQSLVRESGWTPRQYEEWLTASLAQQLLG